MPPLARTSSHASTKTDHSVWQASLPASRSISPTKPDVHRVKPGHAIEFALDLFGKAISIPGINKHQPERGHPRD